VSIGGGGDRGVRAGGWSLRLVAGGVRVVAVLLFLAPVAAMLLGSFRGSGLPPPSTIELLPRAPTVGNYALAFDAVPLARYGMNSVLVSLVVVPTSVLVASGAGFAAARLPPLGRRIVVAVALAAFMFPATAVMVGRFSLFRSLGVTDGPVPLVAPALLGVTPLFVLVYAIAFRRIRIELFDIAGELGASPLDVWWRIGLPMVRRVTAPIAVLAFAITWGEVADAMVYVTHERWFTMPLGLRALAELPPTEQPVMLAASVLALIPVIAAFAFAQWWVARRETA
jgi:multiple sugar transport system permease protein